jgi:hypothetical protein
MNAQLLGGGSEPSGGCGKCRVNNNFFFFFKYEEFVKMSQLNG